VPKLSRKFKVPRPVDQELLIVLGKAKPELDLPLIRELIDWQEVAPIDVRAVRREGIDLRW
jgi:hypothetical protein